MLFTIKIHRYIFLFGLAVSLCALPFSPFALSVGFLIVAINWLLDGLWVEKINRFLDKKTLWVFLLVYASIVIGVFYSENIKYAFKELRLWLPILIIPVVLATSAPLKKGELKLLLMLFCSAVLVATLISIFIFLKEYSYSGQNVRYISPFISHIRLSLMVNLSIFLLSYFAFQKEYFKNIIVKGVLILIAIWFVFFLFILQSLSGIFILLVVSSFFLIRWAFSLKEPFVKFSLIVGIAFTFLFMLSYISHTVDRYFTRTVVNFKSLPKTTINGNAYFHDTLSSQYENGNLVWINVCSPELKRGWIKLSKIPYDGKDKDNESIRLTLIRYLASKGLTKDSVGLSKLDSLDVKLIESSVSSVIYREHKAGIYPRLYQLLWEIDSYNTRGAVGGSSLMQRYIYLKASWDIIKKNILFGVGTGDGKDSMIKYYKTSGINLDQKYWFISHNQFLTVWIASGLIGLLMFIIGLLFPLFYDKKGCFLCTTILLIVMLSMLTEDTFETHIGISFVALFYSIFFFGYNFAQEYQNE